MDDLLFQFTSMVVSDKQESLLKILSLTSASEDALQLFLSGAQDELFCPLDKLCNGAQKDTLLVLLLSVLNDNNNTMDIEMKRVVLEILRNFSRSSANRNKLFNHPGLLDTLLQIARYEPMMMLKSYAIGTLSNLAILDEMAHALLLQKPEMCDILIFCVTSPESSEEVKEKAIKTLMNLAASTENKAALANQAVVLDTLIEHARNGISCKIKERAAKSVEQSLHQRCESCDFV